MRTSTWSTTVAVAIAVVLAGAAVWLVGIVGVGQSLEDVCLNDLDNRARYGAYQSRGSLWPPSLECRLVGSDVEPIVVQHRLEAVAWFGAVVVFPVVYGLAATLAPHSLVWLVACLEVDVYVARRCERSRWGRA